MSILMGVFLPGHLEVIIILAVILLLFGHRLPSMMRNMGRSVNSFKQGIHEGEEDDAEPTKEVSSS